MSLSNTSYYFSAVTQFAETRIDRLSVPDVPRFTAAKKVIRPSGQPNPETPPPHLYNDVQESGNYGIAISSLWLYYFDDFYLYDVLPKF
jgi:hypothetical protein